MQPLKFSLLLVVVMLFSSLAMADSALYTDGNDLISWLDTDDEYSFNEALSFTYVRAIADTLDGHYFCIPGGTKVSQLAAVVEKYLTLNPEKWHESAHSLVFMRLYRHSLAKQINESVARQTSH